MRKDLDHLPAKKQRELERVVEILFQEFEEAVALATWTPRRTVILLGGGRDGSFGCSISR